MDERRLSLRAWENIALDPRPSVEQDMLRDLVENRMGVRWEDYVRGLRTLRQWREEAGDEA